MARQDRQFAQQVAKQVTDLLAARGDIRSLPADIMLSALSRYRDGKLPAGQDRLAMKDVADHLRGAMADFEIQTGSVRTLGKAGPASGLTVYSAKPIKEDERVFLSAYFHAFIFRQEEYWFLSSIEPAMTTTHLYERILARSQDMYPDFSTAQRRFSAYWPLLIEAGKQLKRMRGSAGAIIYFAFPWADGLLLGDMQKVSGNAAGRPTLLRMRGNVGEQRNLQDAYTLGDERALVFIKTFIGPGEMKPGQIALAKRMNALLDAYPDVVEHLRLRWQIAHGFEDEISSEIMRVMGMQKVAPERIQQAVNEMIAITDTEEWLREAKFNKASQERYKTDAQRRDGKA